MCCCVFLSKLSEFCDSLQDPLRIPKPNAVKLTHMDLPLCLGDKVHCVDVLMSLAKQVRSPYHSLTLVTNIILRVLMFIILFATRAGVCR